MGHKFHSKKPLVTAEFDKQDKEARMGIPSSPVANETQFIDKKFEGLPWYKREVYVPDQVKLLATQSVGACEPGD
jgi:hypothetical protein